MILKNCTDNTLLTLFSLGFKELQQMHYSLFKSKQKVASVAWVSTYRFYYLCVLFDAALIKFLNIYLTLENATSKQNVH